MTTVLTVLIAGIVVALALGVIAVRAHRRTVATRRVEELYEAATAGDRDRLRQWVARGRSVNLRNTDGDTALHFAYYHGQQDVIDALVEYGADANLRNKEGLSAVEMGVVAAIEDQLDEGVDCLDDDGRWVDRERGRVLFHRLRQHRPRVYNPALVRCAVDGPDLRRLLFLAIKLGVRGSEERLVQVLDGYGTKRMATYYLNAGSRVLREGAEAWAKRHDYKIVHTGGHAPVMWGRF